MLTYSYIVPPAVLRRYRVLIIGSFTTVQTHAVCRALSVTSNLRSPSPRLKPRSAHSPRSGRALRLQFHPSIRLRHCRVIGQRDCRRDTGLGLHRIVGLWLCWIVGGAALADNLIKT